MTATAFAFDPALDFFDDVDAPAPNRPQLRLITGEALGATATSGQVLAPAASIEIYRRRRFLALVAITTLVLALAWAAGVSVTSFAGSTAPVGAGEAAPTVHVVLPGDSYGAIASSLGASNPIAAGEVLRAANGGAELVIGQRLVVDPATLVAVG